jgi:hypothetical protein
MRQYMHQQPLLAPHLPNRSSSAGHRSGVSGRIVSFMPPFLFVIPGRTVLSIWDLGLSTKYPLPTHWTKRLARATMSRDSFCARRTSTTKGGKQPRLCHDPGEACSYRKCARICRTSATGQTQKYPMKAITSALAQPRDVAIGDRSRFNAASGLRR